MSVPSWIRCRVRPGVFSSEFIVSITVVGHEQREIEFITDRRSVKHPINGGQTNIGHVRVWLDDDPEKNPLRIIVPASGGSDSMAVSVPKEELVTA